MAARSKKSSSPLMLWLIAIAVLGGIFMLSSKSSPVSQPASNKVDTTVKPVSSQMPVSLSQSSTGSPVGWNHFAVKAGPKNGQVTLSWVRISPDGEKYNVVYGLVSGKYIYSALNIADSTPKDLNYSFVIGALKSGTRYYFALEPQKGGVPTKPIGELSVVSP